MNINTNEIESKLRNIFKSNKLNLDIDFQYSSFRDYDIQCNSLLKEKSNNLIESIKDQIIEGLASLN